jgi:hypothetical protein
MDCASAIRLARQQSLSPARCLHAEMQLNAMLALIANTGYIFGEMPSL